ncbi:MAG: AAA-like domain-containing protein, partial [Pseudomonadota bacterium]
MSQQEGRDKLDATGEFFSVGAPLHAVRAGYVKRRADDLLFETVAAGRYAHVIAPDRSGKSSLIAATSARLENNGAKVAILDLAQMGVRDGGSDAGRWYYSVAYRLLRQLRIRFDLQDWWQDKSFLSNRQRLVEFYTEVVLQNVADRIVVFIDEIQCIEDLPYADQLLASIRAAHNARMTDPDFSRITFVLSGECDPVSLVDEAELSPFNVTQQVPLDDFSRDDLELFATELNLDSANAALALDRIYYWTSGQPYLTQKLARAVSREGTKGDIEDQVDHIALHQLAGRAALHNEPHMSHIHRRLVKDGGDNDALLNLYGKLRKGIEVPADLGSAEQRRLMAVGLVIIDGDGNLAVRNRLYGAVFTTRWANENLPTNLRVPLFVAAGLLICVLIPFWYTQWLPGPYVRALADDTTELEVATEAYQNYATFPGHSDTATSLYRSYLERRAQATSDIDEIVELSQALADLPGAGRLPADVEAGFWDRQMYAALRNEDRDTALIANLRSLVGSTSKRRQRAATLVSDDYPNLLTTLPPLPEGRTVFDPENIVLTTVSGAAINQWAWSGQALLPREPWSVTALEVTPLVRRVVVDREGTVNRISMTLNISHARMSDLRVRVIAPSGRAVEIDPGVEHASTGDDIRIPSSQLRDFAGESLSGTWSLSVRDEVLGVAGQLVGWNLTLNSQGAVEYFQRGLNISDPVERETDNLWFDESGRYVVARATQSDSARIWDLSFAQPLRAVAVSASESLIGVDANASRLVTATQDSVNVWDTASGDRIASLPIGAGSKDAWLTSTGSHLFAILRGDVESRLQLWSLETAAIESE